MIKTEKSTNDSYQERWRERPCETRQPANLQGANSFRMGMDILRDEKTMWIPDTAFLMKSSIFCGKWKIRRIGIGQKDF